MKTRLLLIIGTVLLASCAPQNPTGMNNSPMGHTMMGQDTTKPSTTTFLPGMHADLAALPEAQPSQVLAVADGQTITLNPTIVKKTINGKEFAMYGYNGQFPGPLIKVPQGSTFTVDVTNNTDVPTSVHWHGIRLENKNDGTVGVTQEAIAPGSKFTYTVRVPDEGMFWYHPHVREDTQQDMGLYGNLWVTPKAQNAYDPVNREEAVFLDDISLGTDGLPVAYGAENADFALMGRFGNTMLTNGQTRYALNVDKGSVVRFYLTNAANTRTFRVTIPGAKLKLVGGDSGRYEQSSMVDAVILSPSERAIVEAYFEKPGNYALKNETPEKTYTLGAIAVSDASAFPSYASVFGKAQQNQDVIAEVDAVRPFFAKEPDETVHLSVESTMAQASGGGMQHGGMQHGGTMMDTGQTIEWEDPMPMMNAAASKENTKWKLIDQASSKENMDIKYQFKKGEKVKIRLINDEESDGSDHPMQHPIHFHGQRFLVLSVDGKPNENLVWKDTVLVEKGQTVDILLDASNPGDWMFHCHIAEHLSNGMMGEFSVTQ